MDSIVINKFIEKISEIFLTIFNQEIVAEDPYVLTNSDDHEWDISGIIGVNGNSIGVVSIRFTNNVVNKLFELAKIGSSDITKNWSMINDMTGEITNTVAGNVLSDIDGKDFMISIPITVSGENHIISWPKGKEVIAIPFSMPLGEFEFQLSLEIDGKQVTL